MTEKKLVIYKSPDCPHCDEAKEVASEVASENRMQLEERDVMTHTPPEDVTDVPSVCLIDEEGTEHCITGFEDKETFRQELKRLIGKRVIV